MTVPMCGAPETGSTPTFSHVRAAARTILPAWW
jgi:hypothetical protein